MRGREFIGGILLGALIGATMGLLLAPQSGDETRESMREYADELGGKVREGSRHFMESSRDLLEQSKSQVGSLVKRGGKVDLAHNLSSDNATE
jgi:gas vesicle protein